MKLVLSILACMAFGANAFKDLGNGAVESEVVNPGAKSEKASQLKKDGDDVLVVGNKDRNAVGKMSRWIGGIVPYVIDPSLNAVMKPLVDQAFADYHKYTCIKFVKRTNEDDYIKIVDGAGCSSYVGRISKKGGQEVTLNRWCNSKGTVIHELMHAIGFGHEQCRPDRDNFISVDINQVPSDMRHNFDKYDGTNNNVYGQTFGFAYDFGSIMHYDNASFGQNGAIVMRRKDGKPLIVQDLGFGDYDIKKINIYYGCDKGGPAAPAGEFLTTPVPPPAQWACKKVVRDISCEGIAKKCDVGYGWSWSFDGTTCTQTCQCQ